MQVEEAVRAGVRTSAAVEVRRIQPTRGIVPIDLRELWRYRELLYRLIWRDVKARYKQTFLGPIWAIARPLISMVLLAGIFGGLAGFKSGTNVPYPLFLYGGLLIWTYFSSVLTSVSTSLLSNASLLSKVYFPRLFAPVAAGCAPLVDFALSLVVLFGLFPYYHRAPSWHIVFLPFFVLLALVAGLGVGLWLAGVVVRYRDVTFTMPYLVQIWMYATPVLYPVSKLPEPFRTMIAFNPMTSVCDGFRWSLLGISPPNLTVLTVSGALALLLTASGLFAFRRTERTIVDMA